MYYMQNLGCVNDRVQQIRDLYRNANFLRAAQKMMTSGVGYQMEGYEEPSIGTGFHCPPRAKKAPDPRFRLPEQCPCPPATVTVRNPVVEIYISFYLHY